MARCGERNVSFKTSAPPRRRHEREPDEFASYTPRPRAPARVATAVDLAVVAHQAAPKLENRRQQSIRDSARGEECTVRIPGVCNHDPATSVWSHANFGAADKGGAIKAFDLCGAVACSACHDVVDGRAKPPPGYSREQVLLDWMFGHLRSLVRLRQKGLV